MVRLMLSTIIMGLVASSTAPELAAPAIPCPPGQPTMLSGTGPARVGILLDWEGQVIGGGVIRADGTWQLPVQPSIDAPSGDYSVSVTQRDSGAVLGAWTCQVVNTTLPTPGQRMSRVGDVVPPTATPPATTAPADATPPSTTAPADATPPSTTAPADATPPSTTAPADATPPSTTATATASPTDESLRIAICTAVCIVTADVTLDDAPGYLVIQNDGTATTDLSGWTLRSDAGATLTLAATLASGDVLLIYGTAGDDESGMVYWPAAPFQAGTTITLTDAAGTVRQTYRMPQRDTPDREVQP